MCVFCPLGRKSFFENSIYIAWFNVTYYRVFIVKTRMSTNGQSELRGKDKEKKSIYF